MNDPAASSEQPPYWEKCEQMTFIQLRRFIERALMKLSRPSALGNEELPRSEEELLNLCDMLNAKAGELREDVSRPMPERPTYEGPVDPGPFTPSYELRSLYNKLERYERRVDDTYREGASSIVTEYVEGELEEVEREVAPVESREKQEHEKRLEEYRGARKPYWDRVRLYEEEVAKEERKRELEANRQGTVERMRREVKHALDPERASGHKRMSILPFELAAPGERTDDHSIYRYFREVVSRGRLDGFDQDRLGKLLALPRSNWAKGKAGSYGYIVLMFDHTEKVLMECPVRDNAIYVLDSGEERLLKMNKQELIASGEAKRIFHRGNWYQRVKETLDIQ